MTLIITTTYNMSDDGGAGEQRFDWVVALVTAVRVL